MFTYGLAYWLTARIDAGVPTPGHRLLQFFCRDVQVPLRLLDVGMAEHQLNRADVHVLRQEATRALLTQAVRMS